MKNLPLVLYILGFILILSSVIISYFEFKNYALQSFLLLIGIGLGLPKTYLYYSDFGFQIKNNNFVKKISKKCKLL